MASLDLADLSQHDSVPAAPQDIPHPSLPYYAAGGAAHRFCESLKTKNIIAIGRPGGLDLR